MHSKNSKSIEKLNQLRDRAAHLSGVAFTKVRGVAQTKLTGRSKVVGLAAAGVMTAGLVTGTAALINASSTPATDTVAVAEATERQAAADRANRSGRIAATSAPAKAPAAKAPAAPAAPKKAAAPAAKKAAAPAKKAAPAPKWVSPMPGVPLSSCFGPRWGTVHKGIDFAGRNGTKIRSVGAGRVAAVGWNYTGYGNSVVIDHGWGYLSHYAHSSKALVKVGQKVKPGQPIALEGSTGDSTGPHLHFEIHKGMWNQIDPAKWLRAKGVKSGC